MNAAVSKLADAGGKGGARRGTEPLRIVGPHPVRPGRDQAHAGRFGPYVTDGTTNATLPKTVQPEALTLDEAVALIDTRAAAGPSKGKGKKAPEKKAPAKPKAKAARIALSGHRRRTVIKSG